MAVHRRPGSDLGVWRAQNPQYCSRQFLCLGRLCHGQFGSPDCFLGLAAGCVFVGHVGGRTGGGGTGCALDRARLVALFLWPRRGLVGAGHIRHVSHDGRPHQIDLGRQSFLCVRALWLVWQHRHWQPNLCGLRLHVGGFGGGGGGNAAVSAAAQGGCSYQGGAGGGGGGGITSGNSAFAGAAGGSITALAGGGGAAGGAAATTTSAGGNGTAGTTFQFGGGGGGGGGTLSGVGGTGGDGGIAAGGGGGGGSFNGSNSGAGGAGGSGCIRVYTW